MAATATWGPRVSTSLVVNAGALTFLAFGFWSFFHGQSSLLYAAAILLALLTMYALDKTLGICAAFVFLGLLGDIRRVVGWIFGFPGNDPLIVVATAMALVIALPILLRLKVTGLTEKLIVALMGVMVLQIFNPAQGGLVVGVVGAVLAFPPLLWFWIGRTVGNEAIMYRVLYKVVLPIAILAALLGYYQVFVGLPIWQLAWFNHIISNYAALGIGDAIRAFGFSSSASEYMNLLLLATVACLVGCVAGRMVLSLPLVVLLPAIVLGSERAIAFRLLLAVVIAFTFKNRGRGPLTIRFVVLLVLITGLFAVALSQVGDFSAPTSGATGVDRALEHEIGGLAHPLDRKYSTAVGHSYQVWWGFTSAFQHPIGYGIGTTGIASTRGSGSEAGASEFEISDAFINLGLPGGLIFLALIFSILRDAIRNVRDGSRLISLTMVSLLFCLIGSWMFNGEYGNGPILWFLIGSLRRSQEMKLVSVRSKAEFESEGVELQLAH